MVDWTTAMAIGDCPSVVSQLAHAEAPVEQLALARCLDKLGEDGRAIEVASGIDGPLGPYARLVKARALLDRDRAAEAVATLTDLQLPGDDDELLRGRALVLAGRSEEARDGLRELLDGDNGAEARWWLAKGAEDRGDISGAVTVWRALWSKNPTSPFAEKSAEKLLLNKKPVPDFSTNAGREIATTRAKALLRMRLASDAIPLLDGCIAAAPYTEPTSMRWFADALFDAKQYARAVEWYEKAGFDVIDSATYFQYALATARSGNYPRAATIYAQLIQRFPTSSEADEASWKPGYMHHDAGELPEAIAGFTAYLTKHPNGKFASDARYFIAWDHLKLGHTKEAVAAFDVVLARDPSTDLAAAAQYWKARTVGSDDALRAVLHDRPDSAYAWFASKRLNVMIPTVAASTRPEFPAAWLADRPVVATGTVLARSGMADWARPLLRTGVADAASAETTALPMAWALIDAEDYRGAKSLACPYRTQPAGRDACTPRPHQSVVRQTAHEYGLDPLLPYAIMNAESGLDPSVTSPAGARGLMQLMPKLAGDLATNRVAGFHPDDLYSAGTNAFLGTTELGLLQGRFAHSAVTPSLPFVIASYNGGAEAVERWLGTYTTPPEIDRFCEDISFTETRRYVRRVLGFLQQYRRVYGDE